MPKFKKNAQETTITVSQEELVILLNGLHLEIVRDGLPGVVKQYEGTLERMISLENRLIRLVK